MWKSAGISLGIGIAAIDLGKGILDSNRTFTSWIDSPDAAKQGALLTADIDVSLRHVEVLALENGACQAFSGTTVPVTAGTLPPSLTEHWPLLARERLLPPELWPVPGGISADLPPIMITFLFPLDVQVDLGPPQQVAPLDLQLYGVTNISNLDVNVFEIGPQFIPIDMTEAADAAEAAEAAAAAG